MHLVAEVDATEPVAERKDSVVSEGVGQHEHQEDDIGHGQTRQQHVRSEAAQGCS